MMCNGEGVSNSLILITLFLFPMGNRRLFVWYVRRSFKRELPV